MERCPYIYVTSEGKQSQCIHDENDAHRHTLSNYPWQQYGNPTRWKLPQDFRGTALTPVIVPSDRGLIMYTMLHVHGQAGTCIKNRFTSTADCPVVKNHESCPEKTDSEKQPCDYEYHVLSNSGRKVERYPCIGKLGHVEKSGSHMYDNGDGIKRVGNIRNAWHKKPAEPAVEKQPEYVAVEHRVVIAINDLGTVREFNRSLTSLNDAPGVMESLIKRIVPKGAHILNVRVEARTVTTTAWEAMG